MNSAVNADWKWADKFLPDIKRILGECLIATAPIEDDAERNTDLIVLKLDAVRIGCRIRRYSYLLRYPDEFTIRAGRPSGAKTELAKIIEGWGDYFFYGFANETESGLARWTLGNLKVFRLWFNRYMATNHGMLPGIEQFNGDGSSVFRAFSWCELPDEFIVERNWG